MNEEQITYVVGELRAGIDRDTIAQTLRNSGYNDALINNVFTEADRRLSGGVPPAEATGEQASAAAATASLSPIGLIRWGLQQAFASSSLVGWSLLMSVAGTILMFIAVGGAAFLSMSTSSWVIGVVVGVLGFAAGIVVYIMNALALLFAVADQNRPTYWEAWRKGWRRFWSYLVLSLVGSLMMMAGFVLLIIPGIILAVYFVLAQVVFVREGKTGVAAYARSLELIKGAWWGTLGRGALFMLLLIVVTAVLGTALSVLGPVGDAVSQLVQFIIQAFVTVAVIFMLTAWYEARVAVTGDVASTSTMPLHILLWFGVVAFFLVPVIIGASVMSDLNEARERAQEAAGASLETSVDIEQLMEEEFGAYE